MFTISFIKISCTRLQMFNFSLKVIFLFFLIMPTVTLGQESKEISKLTMGWYYPTINAMVSRADFHSAVNLWIKEYDPLFKIKQTNVKLYDHIENMRTDFDNGNLDIIIAPPLLIVNHFELKTLADGFTGESTTNEPFDIVVLARKASNIKTVADFKNKRLVITDYDELGKVFLNSLVIPKFKQPYSQVFRSTQYLLKQNAIVHKLFFSEADVGVVYLETFNLMTELNPQIKQKLTIIDRFPIKSPNYSYFHYKFPDTLRKQFIKTTLSFNDSLRSKEILSNFRLTSLIGCTVESLTPFIKLSNKNKQLIKQLK